jgi:hypothetical protein
LKRIIICGSRGWHDRAAIESKLYELAIQHGNDLTIVHGGARGADRIAEQEAQKAGLLIEAHPADWERYGKPAGVIRNHKMAELGADLCVAFLKDNSSGTRNMIEQARKFGIPVEIIEA